MFTKKRRIRLALAICFVFIQSSKANWFSWENTKKWDLSSGQNEITYAINFGPHTWLDLWKRCQWFGPNHPYVTLNSPYSQRQPPSHVKEKKIGRGKPQKEDKRVNGKKTDSPFNFSIVTLELVSLENPDMYILATETIALKFSIELDLNVPDLLKELWANWQAVIKKTYRVPFGREEPILEVFPLSFKETYYRVKRLNFPENGLSII